MGITSNVQEAATAMRMLTAYDALEQERKKLYDVAPDVYESGKKLACLHSSLGPAAQALLQARQYPDHPVRRIPSGAGEDTRFELSPI